MSIRSIVFSINHRRTITVLSVLLIAFQSLAADQVGTGDTTIAQSPTHEETIPAAFPSGSPRAIVSRLTDLLRARDYDKLEYWVKTLETNQQFDQLTDLYDSIDKVSDVLPILDEWCHCTPESSTAFLFRGAFYIDYAWDARGSGWAREVTKGRWQLFDERLKQAQTDLNRAAQLRPTSPDAPALLLKVAIGLRLDRSYMEEQFRRATVLAPYHYGAHASKTVYLLPKWYGTGDEFLKFAIAASHSAPATSRTHFLLAIASYERYTGSKERAAYMGSPVVWQEVATTFSEYLKRHPDDIFAHNKLAKYAYIAKNFVLAQQEFDRIGDDWDEDCWHTRTWFEQARTYTLKKVRPFVTECPLVPRNR